MSRTLVSGAQLPSQKELAHQYGVAPMTVRQALTRLADEGLVIARTGCGTYVAPCESAEDNAGLEVVNGRTSGPPICIPITDGHQSADANWATVQHRQPRPAGEAVGDRLARLQAASVAFSEAETPESAAAVVVKECVAVSGAAAGTLFGVRNAGDLELIHAVGYDQHALAGYRRIPLNAPVPLAEAVRTGAPLWLETNILADRYAEIEQVARRSGHDAIVAVPLPAHGRVIGVLGLSFVEVRHLGQDDRAFILALASQAAQALDRARLFDAERTARLAAEAAQARMQAAFQAAPLPLMVSDVSGKIELWNPACERVFGWTEAEVLGGVNPLVPADVSANPHALFEASLGGASAMSQELQRRHKDGHLIDLLASVAPFTDPSGAVTGVMAIGIDISDQKRVEDALAASELRYRSVVETSLDGILMTDLSGRIIFANRQMASLLALSSPGELTGRHIIEYIAASDRDAAVCGMEDLVKLGSVSARHFAVVREDGASFPCELSASLVVSTDGLPSAATVVIRDMTERQAYEEQLRRQALHDSLTDLPNRTLFNDRLAQVLLSARREEAPFALLLLDLDRFKEVNDTLGHGTGDILLQQVAARLRDALRESDTVARLGGDEFAIILPNADEQGAIQVINALLNDFVEPLVVGQHPYYLEFSIGVALFPEHAEDIAMLLRCADVAMYTAKQSGGSYAVYEAKTDPNSERRLALMAGLRRAIDEDQLVLHYQPKVHLGTGLAARVEALVRWNHPQFGFISPDQFISIAEHTGLIRPMSLWVLNEALRQIASWRVAGHDIAVAVNLSTCNLQESDLVDRITKLLAKWGVSASSLGIEITESTLMADPDHAMATLTLLHDMGIRVSIDDFGTGYSSLAYLQRLPADELKIDRAFVAGMGTPGSGSSSIVRSVVDLGHTLDLRVVAEGVETQQDLDILRAMGCDVAQGYYLGKPMPGGEYIAWLDAWDQRGWFLPSGAAAS